MILDVATIEYCLFAIVDLTKHKLLKDAIVALITRRDQECVPSAYNQGWTYLHTLPQSLTQRFGLISTPYLEE